MGGEEGEKEGRKGKGGRGFLALRGSSSCQSRQPLRVVNAQ